MNIERIKRIKRIDADSKELGAVIVTAILAAALFGWLGAAAVALMLTPVA